ncbi:hypothetical protein DPMN_085428 [Dreissena polymorpha]|uniref:Uncharacterized protein n=1 Tax=Dreissena polymorpha TaxID=45954 RepID=A0A9D3YFR5_DREPO|nr:hypothetical protein DPMN_085428 [Dreissena polymorpha]
MVKGEGQGLLKVLYATEGENRKSEENPGETNNQLRASGTFVIVTDQLPASSTFVIVTDQLQASSTSVIVTDQTICYSYGTVTDQLRASHISSTFVIVTDQLWTSGTFVIFICHSYGPGITDQLRASVTSVIVTGESHQGTSVILTDQLRARHISGRHISSTSVIVTGQLRASGTSVIRYICHNKGPRHNISYTSVIVRSQLGARGQKGPVRGQVGTSVIVRGQLKDMKAHQGYICPSKGPVRGQGPRTSVVHLSYCSSVIGSSVIRNICTSAVHLHISGKSVIVMGQGPAQYQEHSW